MTQPTQMEFRASIIETIRQYPHMAVAIKEALEHRKFIDEDKRDHLERIIATVEKHGVLIGEDTSEPEYYAWEPTKFEDTHMLNIDWADFTGVDNEDR